MSRVSSSHSSVFSSSVWQFSVLGRNLLVRTFCKEAEDTQGICSLLQSSDTCVLDALKSWISGGNSFSGEILSELYNGLRRQNRHNDVLKLLKYVREERLVKLTKQHCIWEMETLCGRRGMAKAETYYNSLPVEMKTDEVTAALISSLAREKGLVKAEAWAEKLKKPTTEVLDVLMKLYLHRDRHEKMLNLYDKMQSLGLELSLRTFVMMLEYKQRVGGLEGIEREAEAAARRAETESVLRSALNDAMELYGYLGEKEGVERTWSKLRSSSPLIHQSSYLKALAAFGRVGEVVQAEDLLREIAAADEKCQKLRPNPYCLMIEAFANNGMVDRAEFVLRNQLKEALFDPYNSLIRAYVTSNKIPVAMKKLWQGMLAIPRKQIRPDYKTMMVLLPVFAAKRDVDGAEKIMYHYQFVGDTRVYNELLKVYVACNTVPTDFKNRLMSHGIEADQVTEELLEALLNSPSAPSLAERRRMRDAEKKFLRLNTKFHWQ